MGLAYIRSQKSNIDKSGDPPNAAANGRLNGSYKSSTWIVSGQVSYMF
jgi:hypothetical protein